MKFDFLIILYCLFCAWFMGFLVKRLFLFENNKNNLLENIAVCFGLGSGIIYYLTLFSSFFLNFPYISAIYFFLFILVLISMILKKPTWTNMVKLDGGDLSTITLICLILLIVFYQIVEGYWGHFGWDGFAIWGFKGKAIFLDKKINLSLLTDFKHYEYAHMTYPLLIPANEAWIYSHLGYVNDQGVRLLSVAFYAALLAVFYGGIRPYVSCHLALLLTVLFAALPVVLEQGTNGNADLPLAFFFLTGSIYLIRWKDNQQTANLVFAAILYGLCAQVKQEGAYMLYCALLIGIVMIGMNFMKKGKRSFIQFSIYLGIIIILYLPWAFIIWKYNIRGWSSITLSSLHWISFTGKQKIIFSVFQYYFQELFNYRIWGFFWIFIILGFLVFLGKIPKQKKVYPLWLLFLLQGMLYICVYTFYLNGTLWYLQTSLTRTLLSIAPLGCFASVLSLFPSNSKSE